MQSPVAAIDAMTASTQSLQRTIADLRRRPGARAVAAARLDARPRADPPRAQRGRAGEPGHLGPNRRSRHHVRESQRGRTPTSRRAPGAQPPNCGRRVDRTSAWRRPSPGWTATSGTSDRWGRRQPRDPVLPRSRSNGRSRSRSTTSTSTLTTPLRTSRPTSCCGCSARTRRALETGWATRLRAGGQRRRGPLDRRLRRPRGHRNSPVAARLDARPHRRHRRVQRDPLPDLGPWR